MRYLNRLGVLFADGGDGILLSSGQVWDSTGFMSSSLLALRDKAIEVERLYADSGVALPRNSGLGHVIAKAKEVADLWVLNREARINPKTLIQVARFGTTAGCILKLRSVRDRREHLRRLVRGHLQSPTPGHNLAVSTLWELELWSLMLDRGIRAELEDPPDLMLDVGGRRIAIACKWLSAEGHVQGVLSQAVDQVHRTGSPGVVALNIDAVVAPEKLYEGNTRAELIAVLDDENCRFLKRHERHLRKYLEDERILGALVSSGCAVDLRGETPRLSFARQTTMWCLEELSAPHEGPLTELVRSLCGR